MIFQDKDFEIRLIEDGKPFYGRDKHSYSFLRHKEHLYGGRRKSIVGRSYENDLALRICLYGKFEDMGIHFLPNSPDFEQMETCTANDKAIVHINCQFVDIDCPKEIENERAKVKEWKLAKFNDLKNHPVKPSIMVDTKRGLHCYWLLDDGKIEHFRYIQMQLIKEFGGDPLCINESHAMRLPGFEHKKVWNDPYTVNVAHHQQLKYTQLQLRNLLPELNEAEINKTVKVVTKETTYWNKDTENADLLTLITDHLEWYKDIPQKIICRCPISEHEDRDPSAWFNKESLWFHCSGCGSILPLDRLSKLLCWDDIQETLSKNKVALDLDGKTASVEDLIGEENSDDTVSSVLQNLVDRLIEYKQRPSGIHINVLKTLISVFEGLEIEDKPVVIPAECGLGKSIAIEEYLKYKCQNDYNFGAIVVKERLEQCNESAKNINTVLYEDFDFGEPQQRLEEFAFVVRGYSLNDCIKDKRKYHPLMCNEHNCNAFDCLVKNNFERQYSYPVVVITHKRLFEGGNTEELLKRLKYFKNIFNEKVERKLLFIDEKPPIFEMGIITRNKFVEFEDFCKSNQSLHHGLEACSKIKEKGYDQVEVDKNDYKI